jgi:hypothetical protein
MTTMELDDREPGGFRPAAFVAGGILLALGASLLVDRSGMLDVSMHRLMPGAFLILFGSLSFINGRGRRRRRAGGGLWLIGIGCWMLISQMHLFGLTYATSWPLFIILMGLMIVIRGWR